METVDDIRNLPELSADTIHIWGVHVPDVLDRLDALHDVLCETEREKAARFHRDIDRRSSIAARGALRVLLSAYTGIPAAGIEFQYSDTGKPYIVPQASCLPGGSARNRRDACDTVSFNVSHSGDWVVLAFGCNRQVGVDVEKIKPEMEVMSIASRYFTAEEIAWIEKASDKQTAFFQLWARKEAYVKATGSALFRELSNIAVPFEDTGEKDGWIFHRLEAGSKYAAAVVTDKPLANLPCYDFGGLKWDS